MPQAAAEIAFRATKVRERIDDADIAIGVTVRMP